MGLPDVRIAVSPELTADELFTFYERNNICEVELCCLNRASFLSCGARAGRQ